MTDPVQANIIAFDPRKQTSGGRHQIGTLAGFRSESVAGFKSECMAGFVGIRNGSSDAVKVKIKPIGAKFGPNIAR